MAKKANIFILVINKIIFSKKHGIGGKSVCKFVVTHLNRRTITG